MNNFLLKHEEFSRVSIYKSISLIHVLKEQLRDILFIPFIIVSVEAKTYKLKPKAKAMLQNTECLLV
jgi:hypothetical protein